MNCFGIFHNWGEAKPSPVNTNNLVQRCEKCGKARVLASVPAPCDHRWVEDGQIQRMLIGFIFRHRCTKCGETRHEEVR
jgi:hypothetical protein